MSLQFNGPPRCSKAVTQFALITSDDNKEQAYFCSSLRVTQLKWRAWELDNFNRINTAKTGLP